MGVKNKNPNAVALGIRGGRARAKSLSVDELSAIGRQGADARMKSLDASERKEIGRKAAKARWANAKKKEDQ